MAVAKALNSTFENAERLQVAMVNFKVSSTGITLTDTKKKYVIAPTRRPCFSLYRLMNALSVVTFERR